MKIELLKTSIGKKSNLVGLRDKIRALFDYVEIPRREQNRLIIALSELLRNSIQYADDGQLTLSVENGAKKTGISFTLSDRGPGIPRLKEVLQGAFPFPPGRGIGILSARRLVDDFEIQTQLGVGTRATGILYVSRLNQKKLEGPGLQRIREKLSEELDAEEMLATIREKEQLVEQLTRELQLTNEGVVALYREIDEKNLELSRVNRVRSTFLANMSHELRTPLNSILALSQILLERIDGELTAEQQKQIEMIRNSGDHLLQLINDILDLSRVEAGKVRIERHWFDPAKPARVAAKSLEPLAVKKNLRLEIEIEEGVPKIFSDEARTRQVILNLLSNAIKFTDKGKVKITVEQTKGREIPEMRLSVKDTGIGISEKNLGYIFDPFHQIETGSARKYGGTGLGLAISKQLVELMGGRIWADSAPGEGSTFTFSLPVDLPEERMPERRQSEEQGRGR